MQRRGQRRPLHISTTITDHIRGPRSRKRMLNLTLIAVYPTSNPSTQRNLPTHGKTLSCKSSRREFNTQKLIAAFSVPSQFFVSFLLGVELGRHTRRIPLPACRCWLGSCKYTSRHLGRSRRAHIIKYGTSNHQERLSATAAVRQG